MRRHLNVIILVLVAALVGVALYFIIPPGEKTYLGLDLQGGLEVVYQARTSTGELPTADEVEKTLSIIERRVNGLGVSESIVQQQGPDQISIQLPGVTDPEQALSIIGKTAQLEFFKDDAEARPVGPVESREEALAQAAERGVPEDDIARFREGFANTEDWALISSPPSTVTDAEGNETTIPELWYIYRRPPELTGAAIADARQGFDQFNRPNVLIDFTSEGSDEFQRVTKELWREGLRSGESATFAIVLDNVIESDPRIDHTDPTLRDGISGGAEISGSFTLAEAKDLAFVLNIGALPVSLTPIQQVEVSATLGQDSLRTALIAGLVGLGAVLVFMLAYYRFLGLIADLALIVYGILLWGLFNVIPVTLTLPGIAGLILTIGVACDANIVIFERIKEEVRRGKTVRSAVNSGYALGFKTILDANILTILTAAVLLWLATSQPKGFAFTLILGVLVSMFTAVGFTRALLGVLAMSPAFNRPAFMGVNTGDIEAPQTSSAKPLAGRRRRAQAAPDEGATVAGAPTVAPAGEAAVATPDAASRGSTATTGGRRAAARKRGKKRR
jgi:preprotein translocase subunit SecD